MPKKIELTQKELRLIAKAKRSGHLSFLCPEDHKGRKACSDGEEAEAIIERLAIFFLGR